MKKILFILLLVASLSSCSSSGSTAITSVDVNNFLLQISDKEVQIIDVRTPEEFAAGHLSGAVNIDVSGSSFDLEINKLDKNARFALYCRSGNRSTIAAEKMADAGFTNIINFNKGGFAELESAGAATE